MNKEYVHRGLFDWVSENVIIHQKIGGTKANNLIDLNK